MRVTAVRLAGCLVAVVVAAGCTTAVDGTAAPAASSPTAAAPAPAPAAFSDAGHRFRIAPPPGWTADTGGAQGTAVVFRDPAPAASPFTANINVVVVPAAGLDATVDGARRELRRLPGYAPTTDQAAVLPDGTPAHLLGGTFTDTGSGTQLRNLQMFTVRGASGVVATGTAPAASWGSFAPAFDTALRTLTVAP